MKPTQLAICIAVAAGILGEARAGELTPPTTIAMPPDAAVATFAGGCFWCMEPPFEKLEGVLDVTSGYAGAGEPNPTYEEVSSGATGYAEAIQVRYDPARVGYRTLLDVFWRQIDPTDPGGQFVDRGRQYRSAIFVHDAEQLQLANASRQALEASRRFAKPIATEIVPFDAFYPAEDRHQDYYKRNPIRYRFYRLRSGRDQFLQEAWAGSTPIDAERHTGPADEGIHPRPSP